MIKDELEELRNLLNIFGGWREGRCPAQPVGGGIHLQIAGECQRIKKAWDTTAFSSISNQGLQRYLNFHLTGVRMISDTCSGNMNGGRFFACAFVNSELNGLVRHIIDRYLSYVDTLQAASYAFSNAFISCRQDTMNRLLELMRASAVDARLKNCIIAYVSCMSAVKPGDAFTYAQLFYLEKFLAELAMIFAGETDNPEEKLVDCLLRLNFNHLGFLAYLRNKVMLQTELLPATAKMAELREQVSLLQPYLSALTGYNSCWPSIGSMQTAWLKEEMAFCKAELIAESKREKAEAGEKLPLNLSVAHLGYLTKLFSEESLFSTENLTQVFRFTARHYRTKRQQSISSGSLSKEFYAPTQVTAAVVRGMLQRMLSRINRDFFPVLLAADTIVHAYLRTR